MYFWSQHISSQPREGLSPGADDDSMVFLPTADREQRFSLLVCKSGCMCMIERPTSVSHIWLVGKNQSFGVTDVLTGVSRLRCVAT